MDQNPIPIQVLETIARWFGADAPRLIAEAKYSSLMEAWQFDYQSPFNSNEQVTYSITKWDGSIDFDRHS